MRVRQTKFFPCILSLLIFSNICSSAQTIFQYRHVKSDKWHLTSLIDEQILYDGEPYSRVEIMNKISVEVLKSHNNDGLLQVHYKIAERQIGNDFYTWNKEYDVTYARDSRGRVSQLEKNLSIPAVRNVPVYPEWALSVSDTWEEGGQEYFDLEHTFGISEIIRIDFLASYRYEGTEVVDNRETEKIAIAYDYRWTPDSYLLRRLQQNQIYPISIVGKFKQWVYWDSIAGKNYAEDGVFSYTCFMNDGHDFTFMGTSRGRAVYMTMMDKNSIVRDAESLDGVEADIVDDGVRITLENIHFEPDSADFLQGEESKLARIASLIGKIPDRDILIIGHTASISPYHDGQELSEERAGTVAQYLIDAGIRKPSQIITKGMGDRQPLAYNDIEEGREKNRRVEIIVLEN